MTDKSKKRAPLIAAVIQLNAQDDVAADMLRALGVVRVRLLTNNPAKVDGLRAHGIEVAREALSILPNEHNADYLAVKAKKMGHL
jgi:GTP cyclohydrolase II